MTASKDLLELKKALWDNNNPKARIANLMGRMLESGVWDAKRLAEIFLLMEQDKEQYANQEKIKLLEERNKLTQGVIDKEPMVGMSAKTEWGKGYISGLEELIHCNEEIIEELEQLKTLKDG